MKNLVASLVVPLVLIGVAPLVAHADIAGFGDFSNFTINVGDSASSPALLANSIHITGQASSESRSIFCNTPQGVGQFTASFTYRATGTPSAFFGACFVIQNSVGGVHTVAPGSAPGGTLLGYSNFNSVFFRSAAVSMESGSLSPGSSSTASYRDGQVSPGSSDTSPVNLFSGHPIDIALSYNGAILHQTLTDTATLATFEAFYPLDIPSIVGGSAASVGFVANTGANVATDQYISNFNFTAVPAPGAAALLGLTGIAATMRRRRSDDTR